MTTQAAQISPATSLRPLRNPVAGWLLAATSLLSVFAMLHHPSVAMHATSAALVEMAEKSSLARAVHGALIALLAVQTFALLELSSQLGFDRRAVRVAAFTYLVGFLAMVGAALISGFILPAIGVRFAGTEGASVEALRYVITAAAISNRVLASFAVLAMSVAIAAWSYELRSRMRAVAILGVIVAVGPAMALLVGALHLEVAGMTLVAGVQGLWGGVLGIGLVRGTGE